MAPEEINTAGNFHIVVRIKDDALLLNEMLSIIVEASSKLYHHL